MGRVERLVGMLGHVWIVRHTDKNKKLSGAGMSVSILYISAKCKVAGNARTGFQQTAGARGLPAGFIRVYSKTMLVLY